MNWYTILYLASIVDNLSAIFLIAAITCGVAALILTIAYFAREYDTHNNSEQFRQRTKELSKISRKLWVSCVIVALLLCLIPSRRDIMLIVAGGAVGEFVGNDQYAKQIPSDIAEWLHKEIREEIAQDTIKAK